MYNNKHAAENNRSKFVNYDDTDFDKSQVKIWSPQDLNLIPDERFYDPIHLNATGAKILSAWIGEELGKAVKTAHLRFPIKPIMIPLSEGFLVNRMKNHPYQSGPFGKVGLWACLGLLLFIGAAGSRGTHQTRAGSTISTGNGEYEPLLRISSWDRLNARG